MSYSEKLLRAAFMPVSTAPVVPVIIPVSQEKKHRCKSCNKKLGLLPFNCRCGDFYCSQHRHAEEHNCSYNYRAAGQQQLATTNILVQHDKLESRI